MSMDDTRIGVWRELVQRLLEGSLPAGPDFEACRAVLRTEPTSDMGFQAICMLLEGALADASLPIDDTQELVPLLKSLARGTVQPGDLV